jgi:hypothetical protein
VRSRSKGDLGAMEVEAFLAKLSDEQARRGIGD